LPLEVSQQADKPPGILRRRTLLVVVEINKNLAMLALPSADVIGPGAHSLIGIVVLVSTAGTMTPHIDMAGGGNPGCRSMMMVGEAKRDVVVLEEFQDVRPIPALVTKLEGVTLFLGQNPQEMSQTLAIGLETRRELEENRPAFWRSIFRRVRMSSIELSQLSPSRFQCVMNFDAFQANKNWSGVSSLQCRTASRDGIR
jgi:hypothetical protein